MRSQKLTTAIPKSRIKKGGAEMSITKNARKPGRWPFSHNRDNDEQPREDNVEESREAAIALRTDGGC